MIALAVVALVGWLVAVWQWRCRVRLSGRLIAILLEHQELSGADIIRLSNGAIGHSVYPALRAAVDLRAQEVRGCGDEFGLARVVVRCAAC